MSDSKSNVLSWAEIIAGAGLLLRGVSSLKNKPAVAGQVRGLGYSTSPVQSGDIIKKVTTREVKDIDDRVSFIQDLIRKGSRSPRIKEQALRILTKRCGAGWCTAEKDYLGEIKAIVDEVRDPRSPVAFRYTRDHPVADQFTSAERLLDLHAGDCDDATILLGSLFMSVGYPVKARVIQDTQSESWSHIYPQVGSPPTNPSRWIPIDITVKKSQVGWEVPGAQQSMLSGRPAGLVVRVKDFSI